MGRSQQSFQKKEVGKRKEQKRKEKAKKALARKEAGKSSPDDMVAYVDEFGRIVDTPPDQQKRTEADLEDIEISVPRVEKTEEDRRKVGRMNYFNDSKGYGFITEQTTGQSVFGHVNEFRDDIVQGDLVSFEIGKGPRGPIASDIRLQK